jgi:hypothetical protein
MPIYEGGPTTKEELDFKAKTHRCECGGSLLVAWGGSTGHNCYMLRCSKDIEHSNFVRPAKISNYDLPGYNMPGTIKRREQDMMQKYGTEKTKQMVRIGGGNPIATLTQKGAADMFMILYPEASKCPSGQAAIVKGALICRDYGLNPAMNHLFLIPYEHKEKVGNVWKVTRIDWSVVLGIKASRLICGREKSYGYVASEYDKPAIYPRVMTDEEQMMIYGEVDKSNLVTICKIKDKDGHIFPGYGKWPKDTEPKGVNKGNSKFNMSCIRAERQALDKLNPGAMPADVDVVDERFVDAPKVTVSEVKPELEQLPEPQMIDESQDEPEPEEVQKTEAKQQVSEPTQAQSQAQPKKANRDSASIKNLGDFFSACLTDLAEHVACKDDVLKALGKSEKDITDPAAEYAALCKKWGK